jgi:D-sedoheptulose 7-phosphate isomerase
MLTDIEIIDNYLDQASTLMLESKSLTSLLDAAGELISRSLMSGGKLMLCGNGGSAADAGAFRTPSLVRDTHGPCHRAVAICPSVGI